MNREKIGLLARKVLIAFGVGVGAAVVVKAGPVIDGIEAQDWPSASGAAVVLATGALAGGLRALVALLTAFVPTDALNGANLLGKWKDAPVETSSAPPTSIDVDP
jgi:hypothetical protein